MGSGLPARCKSQHRFEDSKLHFFLKAFLGAEACWKMLCQGKISLMFASHLVRFHRESDKRLKQVKLKGKDTDGKKREISDMMGGCYSGRENELRYPFPGTQ